VRFRGDQGTCQRKKTFTLRALRPLHTHISTQPAHALALPTLRRPKIQQGLLRGRPGVRRRPPDHHQRPRAAHRALRDGRVPQVRARQRAVGRVHRVLAVHAVYVAEAERVD